MDARSMPLKQLDQIREASSRQGNVPTHTIDEAILASWTRCEAQHKHVADPIAYETLPADVIKEINFENKNLIEASGVPLEQLHGAVSSAGYALLLTDNHGYALNTYLPSHQSTRMIKQAFRPGIDLSEPCIGTSAMSCALSAAKPVVVSGQEHFHEANRSLICAAAPIISPEGQVIGSLDITREHSLGLGSALSMVTQCAREIEDRLLYQLMPHLILQLSWQHQPLASDMLIALDGEGKILGMTPGARRVVESPRGPALDSFQALFNQPFGDLVDAARQESSPLSGRVASGLSLMLHPTLARPKNSIEGSATPKERRHNMLSSSSLPTIPDFGDALLCEKMSIGIKALDREMPVLLLGETGVGKEVMAKTLHDQSSRKAGKFIAINCAAIPETLIESELFGHTEGAFTGSRRGGAPGKIEQAHSGTLFLDEIGDMPLLLQARLLRVLETREISRLGAGESKHVDFQLICATHHSLDAKVTQGTFRADLFYRIKGMSLEIPPLRERSELETFLKEQCIQVTKGKRALSTQALTVLKCYAWPGNVRELRQALTYADLMADEHQNSLTPCHFPSDIVANTADTPRMQEKPTTSLKAKEYEAIAHTLEQTKGHVGQAAERLGIGRATLYRRLKQMRSESN